MADGALDVKDYEVVKRFEGPFSMWKAILAAKTASDPTDEEAQNLASAVANSITEESPIFKDRNDKTKTLSEYIINISDGSFQIPFLATLAPDVDVEVLRLGNNLDTFERDVEFKKNGSQQISLLWDGTTKYTILSKGQTAAVSGSTEDPINPEESSQNILDLDPSTLYKEDAQLKAAVEYYKTGQLPWEVNIEFERVRLDESGFQPKRFDDVVSFNHAYFPDEFTPELTENDKVNARAVFSMVFRKKNTPLIPPCDQYQKYLLYLGLTTREKTLYSEWDTLRLTNGDTATLRRLFEQRQRIGSLIMEMNHHIDISQCVRYMPAAAPGAKEEEASIIDTKDDTQIKDLLRKFVVLYLQARHPVKGYKPDQKTAKKIIADITKVKIPDDLEKYLELWKEQATLLNIPDGIMNTLLILKETPEFFKLMVEEQMQEMYDKIVEKVKENYKDNSALSDFNAMIVDDSHKKRLYKDKIMEIIGWVLENNKKCWEEVKQLHVKLETIEKLQKSCSEQKTADDEKIQTINEEIAKLKGDLDTAKKDTRDIQIESEKSAALAGAEIRKLETELAESLRRNECDLASELCIKLQMLVIEQVNKATTLALDAINLNVEMSDLINNIQQSVVDDSIKGKYKNKLDSLQKRKESIDVNLQRLNEIRDNPSLLQGPATEGAAPAAESAEPAAEPAAPELELPALSDIQQKGGASDEQLQEDLNIMKTQMDALQKEYDECIRCKTKSEADFKKLASDIDGLQQRITELEGFLADERRTTQEAKEDAAAAQAEAASAVKAAAAAEAAKKDLDDIKNALQKQIDELKYATGALLNDKATLQSELVNAEKEKDDATKVAATWVAEAEKASEKAGENNEKLNELINAVQTMGENILNDEEDIKVPNSIIPEIFVDIRNKLRNASKKKTSNPICLVVFFVKFMMKLLFGTARNTTIGRAVQTAISKEIEGANLTNDSATLYDIMKNIFLLLQRMDIDPSQLIELNKILNMFDNKIDNMDQLEKNIKLDIGITFPRVWFQPALEEPSKLITNTPNNIPYSKLLALFVLIGKKYFNTIKAEVATCNVDTIREVNAVLPEAVRPPSQPQPKSPPGPPRPPQTPKAIPEASPEASPEAIPEASPEAIPEASPEAKPDASPKAIPEAPPPIQNVKPTTSFTSTIMALIKQFRGNSTILTGSIKKDLEKHSTNIEKMVAAAGKNSAKQAAIWNKILKGSFLGSVIAKYSRNTKPLSVGTNSIAFTGYDEKGMLPDQIRDKMEKTLSLLWKSITSNFSTISDPKEQKKYFRQLIFDILGTYIHTYNVKDATNEDEKIDLVFKYAKDSIGTRMLRNKDAKQYKLNVFEMFDITKEKLHEYIKMNAKKDDLVKKYPPGFFPPSTEFWGGSIE